MLKGRKQKIEDSIVISIKYSRLLEEIRDTEDKIQGIKDKKIQIGSTKKINLNEDYIKTVKTVINDIENTYSKKDYMLVENDLLDDKLELLSSCKDFMMIKYNIAIRTIIDNDVNYHNTDDYLMNISKILFDDKKAIAKLEKTLYKLHVFLSDKKDDVNDNSNSKELTLEVVQTFLPGIREKLPKLKELGKTILGGIKKHPKVAICVAATSAIVAIGTGTILAIRKRSKQIKSFMKASEDELLVLLLITGICLSVAPNYMGKEEYHKYFQKKMRYINIIKKKVNRNLYEKWFSKSNNASKLLLLDRFDRYLIENTDFIKR